MLSHVFFCWRKLHNIIFMMHSSEKVVCLFFMYYVDLFVFHSILPSPSQPVFHYDEEIKVQAKVINCKKNYVINFNDYFL